MSNLKRIATELARVAGPQESRALSKALKQSLDSVQGLYNELGKLSGVDYDKAENIVELVEEILSKLGDVQHGLVQSKIVIREE